MLFVGLLFAALLTLFIMGLMVAVPVISWRISKSVAYRLAKDDENQWIIIPSFTAIILGLAVGVNALDHYVHGLHVIDDPTPHRIFHAALIYLFCVAGLGVLWGALQLIGHVLGRLFDAINGAIRG